MNSDNSADAHTSFPVASPWLLRLWRGEDTAARRLGFLLISACALVVRWAAASRAFPVSGDPAHFVQYGVELANGNGNGFSTYWSQGMIILAAIASRLGWSPEYTLQTATVIAGTLVTGAVMILGYQIFRTWGHALLSGLLVAVNPSLVWFSVCGFSELPYLALVLPGICLGYRWLGRPTGGKFLAGLGFFLMGLSVYFKALDACLVAATFVLYGGVTIWWERRFRKLPMLFLAGLVFFLTIFPLCLYTYKHDGTFSPGSKSNNLAIGDYWADSKAAGAIEKPWKAKLDYMREKGTAAFMWKYRVEIAGRFARNSVRSFRFLSAHLFTGAFRLGPVWTLVFFLGGFMAVRQRAELHRWILPVLMAVAPLLFICLCLVADRYLIPALPFVMLLVADIVLAWSAAWRSHRLARWLPGILVAAMAAKYAELGIVWADREWRAPNMKIVGEALRKVGDDEDVLMNQGPIVPIYFYRQHPLRQVELPYATIEETGAYGDQQGVTLIAVSDKAWPHWPITQIFHGAKPPADWTLLEELNFRKITPDGDLEEKYLLFRRSGKTAPDQR